VRSGNHRCAVTRSKCAIVTGATSGIGAAVGQTLAAAGMRLLLVGRNSGRLAAAARRFPARRRPVTVVADLRSLPDIRRLLTEVSQQLSGVDVLVHCAGEYQWTADGDLDSGSFDRLFETNVRAPYLLTQGLSPLLERACGQVIFLNSSVIRGAGQGVALFKATQHALLGLTDSLRQELNPRGIRVTSVFPGRTATPRMRRIYAREGRRYTPRLLLRATDVAQVVLTLTELPAAAEVTEVHVRSARSY
jgi:NAD(P)-dependent dehydrogenase (short-subunit alcohol dehydrogenase family)